MTSLTKHHKKTYLWAGAIILLVGGILTLLTSSSPITVIIVIIGLALILIGRFA